MAGVNLTNANMSGVDLGGVDLLQANLSNVDFTRAILKSTRINLDQLKAAKTIAGAILPDGSRTG